MKMRSTRRWTRCTSLLEPIMMVVLGTIIGFIVIAMYLPIFTMAQAIQ